MPVGVGRFHVDRRQARYDRLAPRSIHGTSIDPPLPSLNELDSATGTRMRCATLQPQSLLAQEVPLEVVSELLGHSSIRMTKDVYRPSDRESEAGRCRIDGAGIVGLMCPNPGVWGYPVKGAAHAHARASGCRRRFTNAGLCPSKHNRPTTLPFRVACRNCCVRLDVEGRRDS